VTAPAIGPPLGGWITDNFSWRWVFFINVPIGIVSLLLTSRLLSDPPEFKREAEAAHFAGRLRIDYIGIGLIALGFSCLEVVLDRGQREDWFESHFIVTFFVVAIASLVMAVVWELNHRDPVVEISLLRERNFAISNCFYFIFGFVLFGSTVLIPQMLQSLYGYTATDAGLVLGPGALVIVFMAPIVVRLVKRIPVSRLIAVGFVILGIAMWHYASFNIETDYRHEALARCLQGLGLAFLFVPTSQLAYSRLPREKNNKASSLTNLFRNQGGSFGIAFVTTMIERRSQYHRSVLVSNVSSYNSAYRTVIDGISQRLYHSGYSLTEATHRALAQVNALVDQQSALLGFLDCFWILGCIAFGSALLTFFIHKFNQGGGGAAAH
jgi:DHA2 family multidrug resistance protein